LQDAFGLNFDVTGNQIAGLRINRDLAGAEQQVANPDAMVVRADGGRRFRRFDDGFVRHKMRRKV
jgi:hypothetical protein